MPSRIVREGINTSPLINALSPLAELFYRRLMSVADDYGRFHASPATLRGACWPTCPNRFTDDQISAWLKECCTPLSSCLASDKQLLIRYEFAGAVYLQIQNFGQQTRTKSKFPDPIESNMLINCEANAQPSRISESYFGVGVDSRISESGGAKNSPSKNPAEARKEQAADLIVTQLRREENTVMFSICFDRHKKHRGSETKLHVAHTLRDVNWNEFDARHRPYCEYWDRHGWSVCPVSMLEWWRNGMPLPPPEAVARPGPARESKTEEALRLMTERAGIQLAKGIAK